MAIKGLRLSQANQIDLSGATHAEQFASTDAPAKTDGHIGKWINGNIVDGLIAVGDLVTISGGGTPLMTGGVYGSIVGQVPRGPVNGSNTRFTLDYNLLEWWTWLEIGDIVQLPGVQLDPSNQPFGVMAVPGGEYQVQRGKNYITVAHAPRPGDRFYIWYVRADPASVATNVTLTTTTAFDKNVSPGGGDATQSLYGEGLPFFGHLAFETDSASYAKRTRTYDVTNPLDLVSPLTELGRENLKAYFFSDNGTRFTGYSPGDFFDIYDAYLTVTWADASTSTFRPTTFGVDVNSGLAHMVEDPPNWSSAYAIDGDLNTAARYNRTVGGSFLSTTTGFWVGGWVQVGTTPAPTPVALPPPPIVSGSDSSQVPPNSSGQTINTTGGGTINLPTNLNAPVLPVPTTVSGGSLLARTYYVTETYTNQYGETTTSAEVPISVASGSLLEVPSPPSASGATGWNVYVATTSGGETKQNLGTIPIGTVWTEPSTGLVASTIPAPIVNTASPSPSTFSVTVANTGTSPETIQAPVGVNLNGVAGGTYSVAAGTVAIVLYSATAGYQVVSLASATTTTTGTPILEDSSGAVLFDANGDAVFA
jgi:hypothetical protein